MAFVILAYPLRQLSFRLSQSKKEKKNSVCACNFFFSLFFPPSF